VTGAPRDDGGGDRAPAPDGASPDDAGAAGEADAATTAEASTASAVAGVVVSWSTGRPLPSRTVWIDGQTAVTDDAGRFALGPVAATYDAIVGDPDGLVYSVYRGLTRRDPLLAHAGAPPLSRSASVNGDVSGGAEYPLTGQNVVFVNFFSPQSNRFSPIGGMLTTLETGPGYGPMTLQWDGPSSIAGELTALAFFQQPDGGSSAWFVQQPLTLQDGQAAFSNLALTPVTRSRHVSGSITLPPGLAVGQKEIFYRLPIVDAALDVPVPLSPKFNDDIPDLTDTGATLCVRAVAVPGSATAMRCPASGDSADFSITVQAPPALSSPAAGATVRADTPFAWSAFDSGVYLLELDAVPYSAATPAVYLFTAGTSVTWPDLSALGVSFPAGGEYECTIAGLGPYASMDDAAGPNGVGAPFPTELRRSFTDPIEIFTSP
jgi:hypothetical protein